MTKENNYVIVNYQIDDEKIVDELLKYIEEKAKEIISFFEIEIPFDKPNINIISTKKEYDSNYILKGNCQDGYQVPKWSRGVSWTSRNEIDVLSIHDYKNTTHAFLEDEYASALEDFKKLVIHEYVHYINRIFNKQNNCNFSKKYLYEGIACVLSSQNYSKVQSFDYSIDEILDFNNNLYNCYYLIVKYMIDNLNQKEILNAFKSGEQARKLLKDNFDDIKNFYISYKR